MISNTDLYVRHMFNRDYKIIDLSYHYQTSAPTELTCGTSYCVQVSLVDVNTLTPGVRKNVVHT